MTYTEQDREALYRTWMSYKAKMRITQIEMVKKLGISQLAFSNLMRGKGDLESAFVHRFCQIMQVDPVLTVPSLRDQATQMQGNDSVQLTQRLIFDGDITHVDYQGNELVVTFTHPLTALKNPQ